MMPAINLGKRSAAIDQYRLMNTAFQSRSTGLICDL